jgi:hypothetical protein
METYNVRYSINKAGPTADSGWIYGENNPILSSDLPRKIHGTGHHSVLQEGNDYFMIYPRNDIWVSAGRLTRQTCIDLGRNEPDAWSTFNGELGDVFLYKSALSEAERRELVNFVAAKLVGGGESHAAK